MRVVRMALSPVDGPDDWEALGNVEDAPHDETRVGALLVGELATLGIAALRRSLGIK